MSQRTLSFVNFITCSTLFLLILFCVPAASRAEYMFSHGSAGFRVNIPAQWSLQTGSTGVELDKGSALLSVEYLGITSGDTIDTLALFTPGHQGNSNDTPYPGLRASIQEKGYAAEVVILKTPVGFYLLSLEQDQPDSTNQKTFETILNSFALLDTPPVDIEFDLPNPVTLGPIELAVPDGYLDIQKNSLLWKSDAAGLLTAEVVKLQRGDSLSSLLGDWETAMLTNETGLLSQASMLALTVEDRPAVQADYIGEGMQARVQISAIDKSNTLLLTLITRKETFVSHQPVFDAVSFSVVPRDLSTSTYNTEAIVTKSSKRADYAEVVMAVSDRMLIDAEQVNKLYKNKPKLFRNINKVLKDLNTLEKSLTDTPENLARKATWKDQASTGGSLSVFNAAMRSYKVSLHLLPTDLNALEMPNNILAAYKASRESRDPVISYNELLEQHDEFKGRKELHKKLLNKKKQEKDSISEELSKYLLGKSDLYWRNRLEANYQLSLLKKNMHEIIEEKWMNISADLQRIQSSL